METMLLKQEDVADLLTLDECIAGVESAFRMHGEGKALPPKVLGMHLENGGFHVKAGVLGSENKYFVAKINANFPCNLKQNGLPNIQGVIVVCDAHNGKLLALIDSIEITIVRTGAATAVAAKYLASPNAETVTICGCGNQGTISLMALMKVRPLKKVYAFDIDETVLRRFSAKFSHQLKVFPVKRNELSIALKDSEIVVTCTPSRRPYIHACDIMPGTFIAAVGADSEEKQELFPDLLATNKIVVDIMEQSATIGEVHHALSDNKITMDAIHAELGMVVAGKKPGRESHDEIIIFDSTGMALQDAAAASIVYENALATRMGMKFNFGRLNNDSASKISGYPRAERALRLWFPFR
jgi:alanine dehydrogenase